MIDKAQNKMVKEEDEQVKTKGSFFFPEFQRTVEAESAEEAEQIINDASELEKC